MVSEVEPPAGQSRACREVPDQVQGGGEERPGSSVALRSVPRTAPVSDDNAHVFSWGYVLPTNVIVQMFSYEMIVVVDDRL